MEEITLYLRLLSLVGLHAEHDVLKLDVEDLRGRIGGDVQLRRRDVVEAEVGTLLVGRIRDRPKDVNALETIADNLLGPPKLLGRKVGRAALRRVLVELIS